MKKNYAQGQPITNIPIIQEEHKLAGRKVRPGSHPRKSIHDPTISYESKISLIPKATVDSNII